MAATPDPDEVLCSTSGKTNFQRITRLLICGGTSLLREIFDSICPPSHLPTILSSPITKNDLKHAKLTSPQWHCLCPSPGVYGKSADFDVTLLFRLLRTICNLTPPATGWDALPASSDHCLTADLARIKYYRNSVYGHVNQGMAVADDEFPTLWQEISETLVRIAGKISPAQKTAWQAAIAKYLTAPLTVEDERNLQELKAWYKNDMDVKDAIDHLKTAVQEESKNVKEDISERFDHLKTTVQEESKNLKEDLKHIFESVREEVQGIKRESIAMRRDILEAVGHQEAKDVSNPPVGMIHSKDKNSSLAGKSQLSEDQPKQTNPSSSQLYSEGSLQVESKVTLDNKLAGLTGSETGDIYTGDEGALPAALSPGARLSSLEDLAIPQPEISETCESTVVDGTRMSEPRPGDYNSVSGSYPSEVGKPKKATAGYAGLNISDPGVPLEIFLRGHEAVEGYQDALSFGGIALRRVPLMLIGQSGAGKTSTKKSLKGICFDPEQDSTVGIDVDPSYFKVSTETWCTRGQDQDQNSDKEIYFVFWDFAGQSVYYETHSLFLTEKAIVLLVYDLSLNPEDEAKPVLKQGVYDKSEGSCNLKTNFDYLDFWMRSVASFASSEAEGSLISDEVHPEKLPPVFLVCTHADKPYGRDAKELATKVFGRLESRPYGAHLCDVFVVDNTLSVKNFDSLEIKRLRREIFSTANELPFINERIPMKWLKFEKALQVKREMGNKHITLEAARNIAKNECSIVEEGNFEILMDYLHDIRSLIHYRDTVRLNKLVVLDPQWLVDVFKKVITVKRYDPKEKKYLHLWRMLESQGILDESLVAHAWEPFFKHKETSESLIGIMERFSLLCPWPVPASNRNQYLVPSMLKELPTAEILELVKSAHIPSLFVKFSNGQVPPAFFHRLIVQFMQWGRDWFWSKATPQLFNGFARFYTSEGAYSVIFVCNSSSVEVVVRGGNSAHFSRSSGEVPCAQVCRQLGLILGFMRSEFPWLRNMGCEMCVICPVCSKEREVGFCRTHGAKICKQEQCLHFWPVSKLYSNARNLHCTKSATAPDTVVETEQFSPWFPAPRQQPGTDEYVEESFAVSAGNQEKALAVRSVLEHRSSKFCDTKLVVSRLLQTIQLDQASLEQPDSDTKKLLRCLGREAIRCDRPDVVMYLRKITPAGTTGPILPESGDVRRIPFSQARHLTISLTVADGDKWKLVAEKLGLNPGEIRFLDQGTLNPVEALLGYISNQRYLSVGELYQILCECGVPIIADRL